MPKYILDKVNDDGIEVWFLVQQVALSNPIRWTMWLHRTPVGQDAYILSAADTRSYRPIVSYADDAGWQFCMASVSKLPDSPVKEKALAMHRPISVAPKDVQTRYVDMRQFFEALLGAVELARENPWTEMAYEIQQTSANTAWRVN